MLSDADIRRIVARIVQAYSPLAAGTFGSYAVGLATGRSDLDLFVIVPRAGPPQRRMREVRRLLFDVLCPLDIHVFTPQEFEETAYEDQSFTWVIARQARLYHWTEEAARQVPALRAHNK